MPQQCNLDGIPMNIHEENSAYRFRVQSEREWTLVLCGSGCLSIFLLEQFASHIPYPGALGPGIARNRNVRISEQLQITLILYM